MNNCWTLQLKAWAYPIKFPPPHPIYGLGPKSWSSISIVPCGSRRTGVVLTENIYAMVLNKRKHGSKFNLLLKVESSKWIAMHLSYLPLPKEYQVDRWRLRELFSFSFFSILWCSLGGDHPYVGLVKFRYYQNMKGYFSNILVYLLVRTWTIYRNLTISKKKNCHVKKIGGFF